MLEEKYNLHDTILEKDIEANFYTRVYNATSKDSRKEVIIKYNKVFPTGDKERDNDKLTGLTTITNQLRQEPLILKVLKESNYIVDLIESHEDFLKNNEMWMVLEKAPGNSIGEIIKEESTFSRTTFYSLLYHLVEALSYIHRMGVIHRDLSPNNIFVTINHKAVVTNLKIIDFGLSYYSKKRNFGIRHRNALTYYFAPPEAAKLIHKKITPAYDLFSVGAVLYFVLTSSYPYPSPIFTNKDLEHSLKPIEREDISPKIKAFIYKCLKYEPKERPGSIVDIKGEVFKRTGWLNV
ncbi:protein kinase domain-containing protein [Natranaerofaba carboxydovora]|uniref:protein kinase domain-containing protein n=1 Tax=Natranaerofaba carboxydovora TaxID=2742683 RepID=UPI001F12C256|nr:protein kinase [Natranaerofaba carboxydovora]UMZ73025.1 Serine/threonine-protein kinase AfsK [Natranaerofaba carboxydovora]